MELKNNLTKSVSHIRWTDWSKRPKSLVTFHKKLKKLWNYSLTEYKKRGDVFNP